MDEEKRLRTAEAAALTGLTARAIRHYHRSGLLPEPGRGPDGRRGYGRQDVVRMLWLRRMAELGTAPDEVRTALERTPDPEGQLAELEASLARQERAVRARREAVRRLREAGGDLERLSPEALRALGTAAAGTAEGTAAPAAPSVAERVLGAERARREAVGHHVLALHPRLRSERDRLEAELEALAGVAAEDPRVDRLAHAYFVHGQAMEAAERAACFPEPDFDESAAGAQPPAVPDRPGRPDSAPGELTPAQARCAEILSRLLTQAHPPGP
ncbi:MerR family transcriptional regulator [Streptomyces sp. NPDC058655]|uniref:MerR family transcriptional regulator n=1 Tax=unclassified Streptomyces TaxID=2593676 RepID=UPI003658E68F